MSKSDIEIFYLLKQQVAVTFLKDNTALSTEISEWKGDDILHFQEDLLQKVKGRVSEKWFYNYFRSDIQKLPRIDMLNLLSQYVGEKNWATFISNYNIDTTQKKNKKRKYKLMLIIPLLFFLFWFFYPKENKLSFCFVNENGVSIEEIVHVIILSDDTFEKALKTTETNCISFTTTSKQLRMKITAPYHKEKVIKRSIDVKEYAEQIYLETDIYSLMLRHYANSDTKDWKLRKEKLEDLIAPDALIYQRWFGTKKGAELYTKEEFILQLSVPTSLLKNLEILEIQYVNGRIKKLGFKIK